MDDDMLARRLWRNGLALFFFGLAWGFVFTSMPNTKAGLTAHLNAVQSGTFLVALGLLWPRVSARLRAAGLIGNATWIAFWLLQIGLTLPAFFPPKAAPEPAKVAVLALQVSGSIVMLLTVGAMLIPWKRR